MNQPVVRGEDLDPAVGRQLTGLVLAPLAWGAHLAVSLPLVAVACETGHVWPLHVATVATVVVAMVGAALARQARPDAEATGRAAERARLMAGAGWAVSLLFIALIVVEGIAAFVLGPC